MTRGTPAQTETCDILIRNGYVLTLDSERRVFPSGAVAITGNSIVAVGRDQDLAARFKAKRVLDAAGAPAIAVAPGTCSTWPTYITFGLSSWLACCIAATDVL